MHRSRAAEQKGKARWDPSSGVAIVHRVKGKFMSSMGFGQMLFPEEAVFLADRDEIDLVKFAEDGVSEVPVTGDEVFSVLAECGIDMRAYTAYAALREQRFIVFRAGAWKCRSSKDDMARLLPPKTGVAQRNTSANNNTLLPTLTLTFDVYQPQSGFSKANMPRPDFSIAVLSADDVLPPIASLRQTVLDSEAGVPSRMCIVGDSSVTFVELSIFDPTSDPKKETDFKRVKTG